VDTADHDVESRITSDLTFALAPIQKGHPGATAANLIVGELGSARDTPVTNECVSAVRTVAAIDGAISFGASFAIDWQVVDNTPSGDDFTGFGAYKYDGTESVSGASLHSLLGGATPSPPGACPNINTGGVVNGTSYDANIHPGDVLSIFGSGFAPSGNVVHIKQGTQEFIMNKGAQCGKAQCWWYEAPGQINFTLPPGVVSGAGVRIYVSAGYDSNGQLITVL
jgi:hypothetical protein